MYHWTGQKYDWKSVKIRKTFWIEKKVEIQHTPLTSSNKFLKNLNVREYFKGLLFYNTSTKNLHHPWYHRFWVKKKI